MEKSYDDELIKLCKENKCLWIETDPDFPNKQKKKELWNNLSNKHNVPVEVLQCKWNTFLSTFHHEHSRRDSTREGCGKNWRYYERLTFLIEPESSKIIEVETSTSNKAGVNEASTSKRASVSEASTAKIDNSQASTSKGYDSQASTSKAGSYSTSNVNNEKVSPNLLNPNILSMMLNLGMDKFFEDADELQDQLLNIFGSGSTLSPRLVSTEIKKNETTAHILTSLLDSSADSTPSRSVPTPINNLTGTTKIESTYTSMPVLDPITELKQFIEMLAIKMCNANIHRHQMYDLQEKILRETHDKLKELRPKSPNVGTDV